MLQDTKSVHLFLSSAALLPFLLPPRLCLHSLGLRVDCAFGPQDMSPSTLPRALSALSLASTHSTTASESEQEDWDRSLVSTEPYSVLEASALPRTPPPQAGASSHGSRQAETGAELADATPTRTASTPRNSVVFPGPSDLYTPSFSPGRATRFSTTDERKDGSLGKTKGRRTLSELLRLHSEKGCEGRFSADEASRIADVLGQWVRVARLSVYVSQFLTCSSSYCVCAD